MKRHALSLGVIGWLVLFAWSPDAVAHTKGLTLSRFGLVDVSLQANVAYVTFDNPKVVDFDKIGDRHQKGWNLTSFDLSLTGQLPEFPLKFAMFLTFEQDKTSIEEAFLFFHKLEEFSPLLSDFQATVGQFRAKFGQFNQIHDHEWFLEDPPLIHTKFLGPDGVHLLGAEVTYQVPISTFLQLSLSIQSKGALDGFPGATSNTPPTFALHSADDVVVFPRVETFFDLTDTADLSLGASGAFGRNKPDSRDRTYLIGGDVLLRWKLGAGSYPYLRWLTEGIWAVRENPIVTAGANKGLQLGNDVVGGAFSELGYRFSQHWQATGRVDYVGIPKGHEDEHLRLSGGLRYLISSVAKIGIQYEHSARSGADRPYNAVFVQFNVGLGTVTPGVGKFLDPF
ncbi:MAG: hypothetical protein HY294_09485 [Candidatus Rokubacteria bacterium]|nr:hypothetical protein [Candidatus Rokubacteria bacterium]